MAGLGAEITTDSEEAGSSSGKSLEPTQAKRIVRRIDQHGMHLTGELRERAVGEVA